MNYLDHEQLENENSLSYPDKLWLVMYEDLELWSEPTEDKYTAEQAYHSALDNLEKARFGYVWDGSITGSMPYKEVERNFKEVRV